MAVHSLARAAALSAQRSSTTCTVLAVLAILAGSSSGWQIWTAEESGPGPRAGHTLHLFNETIYLFGGRGNEVRVVHDPRTYKVGTANGSLFFESYSGKHVKSCLDDNGDPMDADSLSPEAFFECYNITIGTYANDLWAYSLNCTRRGDSGCEDKGWSQVMPGAHLGGCINYNETTPCTHPHERWGHSSAILWDRPTPFLEQKLLLSPRRVNARLLVYGGYAQMCEDFCSDMWSFPLTDCLANKTRCAWQKIAEFGRTGPGKRWRAASDDDGLRWIMFGGHRLWHGFAQENSAVNAWGDVGPGSRYPWGGYLDDMWIYASTFRGAGGAYYNNTNMGVGISLKLGAVPTSPSQRELVLGPTIPTEQGSWQQILPRETCYKAYPTQDWADRRDIACTLHWPAPRASAALVIKNEKVYLHGGFRVEYPYPHPKGRGSGPGTGDTAPDSRFAYPGLPVYLSDLWRFDLQSGTWEELFPTALGGVLPSPRRGHTLVLAGEALLLVGGYGGNSFADDMWIYNTTTNHWLLKAHQTHALFHPNCTPDVYLDPGGSGLEFPFIAYDSEGNPTPVQSVAGEPTRGTVLDGIAGRVDYAVFIPQGRRRAPGWDGCRDRADGRTDLPLQLEWLRPSQRGESAGVWSDVWRSLFLYGGETVPRQEAPTLSTTHSTRAVGDLWAWMSRSCPANCSGVGVCWYGHCYCDEGYYGLDCSNSSCPGSYCRYDTANHLQTCTHCCSAPYVHTDEDAYVQNQRKMPCDAEHPGVSHGICNGFGVCQCAPPFLGDDCSIRDCPNNCSSRGYCSAAYPVARCICDLPATGRDCSLTLCPNNCSYPNGVCDPLAGTCACAELPNPYNRSEVYGAFEGEDCSYVTPFAGAAGLAPSPLLTVLLPLCVGLLLLALGGGWAARGGLAGGDDG